jgi:hypothetical protein
MGSGAALALLEWNSCASATFSRIIAETTMGASGEAPIDYRLCCVKHRVPHEAPGGTRSRLGRSVGVWRRFAR